MRHVIRLFALALIIATVFPAFGAVDAETQALLDIMLYTPDARDPNGGKPHADPSDNTVATQEKKINWFSRVGTTLTPQDVSAVKAMIQSSKCEFKPYSGGLPQPETEKIVPPPECKGQQSKLIVQCTGRVECDFPGMPFVVHAICFADSKGKCPAAKECAFQSAFEVKDMQSLAPGAKPEFSSMWIGGWPK